MNATSHLPLRLLSFLLALALAAQCIWILSAELTRPGIARLPADAPSAETAAKQRNDATWAARIGGIRGDLWEESAFTFASLLFADLAGAPAQGTSDAGISVERAIGFAPHLSAAWLLRAGLPSSGSDIDRIEALKMSYYTGPSDLSLMPLRLLVAARVEALSDADIQQLVSRDLHLLLTHNQKAAVTQAYQRATPAAQRYLTKALADIDPAYLELFRAGAPRQ
jgi:hypothetical protein